MARLSEAKLLELIPKMAGNISAIARAFGVNRSAVLEYIQRRPDLAALLQDARETMVDNVESRFYSDCLKEDPAYQTSRIFFLKTQGKHRGYIERQEVAAEVKADVQLTTHDKLAALRERYAADAASDPRTDALPEPLPNPNPNDTPTAVP